MVGTQNKWVMRLELSSITQGETETVEDFICRLRAKARTCSFPQDTVDDQILFQLIKGIKWSDARRKLIAKGNDLTLNNAVTLAHEYQATLTNMSSFEKNSDKASVGAVSRGRPSSQRQSRGRKGPCSRCGTEHPWKNCPAYGKKCGKCGRLNHFESFCLDGKYKPQRSQSRGRRHQYHSPQRSKSKSRQVNTIEFDDTPLNCGSVIFKTCIASVRSNGGRQAIMAKLDIKPSDVTRQATLTVKTDTE